MDGAERKNKPWDPAEIVELDKLVEAKKPPAVIAELLNRPIQGTIAKIGDRQREKRQAGGNGGGNGGDVVTSLPARVEVYAMHNAAQLKKMQGVVKVCQQAAVGLPAEVAAFFGVSAREPQRVDLHNPPRTALKVTQAANPDGSLRGYLVSLPDIDAGELLIVVGAAE